MCEAFVGALMSEGWVKMIVENMLGQTVFAMGAADSERQRKPLKRDQRGKSMMK